MKRCALILTLLALASTSFAVWPTAVRLTDGPNENINPDFGMPDVPTPWGVGVLVWQRSRPGGWDIYSRLNDCGLTWTTPLAVSVLPDSNVTPSVSAFYPARCYCVWMNCHGDSQNILCSRWASTSWDTAMYVTQDTFSNVEPSVRSNIYNDSVAVVWASRRNGVWNLYSRFYLNGQWTNVIPVVMDSGNNRKPHLYLGYSWPPLQLAWQNDVRGNWDILTSRWQGGRWTTPRRITSGGQADVQPAPVKGCNVSWGDMVNLLWASDSVGNWEVFGTNQDSAPPPSPERFTRNDSSDAEPSALLYFLPSQTKTLYHPILTAWTSWRDGNANIYAEHINVTDVVDTSYAEDCKPSVASVQGSKGNWIYDWVIWQSNRDGNWNLYGSYQMLWNGGVESGKLATSFEAGPKLLSPSPFRPPGRMTLLYPGSRSDVSFRFYDLQGRDVGLRRAEKKAPGQYEVTWDGRDASGKLLPSGLYFLKPEGTSALFRIVLLR